jgi:hypothetical protein
MIASHAVKPLWRAEASELSGTTDSIKKGHTFGHKTTSGCWLDHTITGNDFCLIANPELNFRA